jgi:hypothetical protein
MPLHDCDGSTSSRSSIVILSTVSIGIVDGPVAEASHGLEGVPGRPQHRLESGADSHCPSDGVCLLGCSACEHLSACGPGDLSVRICASELPS